MYIFNNLKDFFKMNKVFYGFGVLSWLMVMVGCSPVEPTNQGPVVREVVKISVNDGSGDYDEFGQIVALDGDTAILSAGGEEAAYIFVRNGNSWIQQAKLTPPSGDRSFSFGALVAISGDYAIVGGDGNFFAYIFVRNGTNWTRQATLTSGQFGSSVGIDGNTAIVGESEDGSADRENGLGSAHIYTRDGTNWTRQKILTPSDTSDYSHRFFGHSVAISDNTVIVGAYGGAIITVSPPTVTHRIKGFAYIFTRDGTNWVQQAKLENTNGRGPVERYGWSVAIDGDYAVVGDFLEGREGLEYQTGSVYIFNRSGNNWIQQAKIKASDGEPNDYFGWSVAINGDTVVVSAWGDDDNGSASGASYIFNRSGTSWNQSSKFAASDSALLNHFGKSVAIDGETIVVGATEYIGASIGNQFGLAYFYQMNN